MFSTTLFLKLLAACANAFIHICCRKAKSDKLFRVARKLETQTKTTVIHDLTNDLSRALRVFADQAPVLALVVGDGGCVRYERLGVAGFDEALNCFHMTQL